MAEIGSKRWDHTAVFHEKSFIDASTMFVVLPRVATVAATVAVHRDTSISRPSKFMATSSSRGILERLWRMELKLRNREISP